MNEASNEKEKILFYKIWRAIYPEELSTEETNEPEVRGAIERIYSVINTPEPDYDNLWAKIGKSIKSPQRRVIPMWFRYAGAILIPLLSVALIWLMWQPADKKSIHSNNYIRPHNSIILTMSDGRAIDVREQSSGESWQTSMVEILTDTAGGIVYKDMEKGIANIAYNTLDVPVAADFQLQLSDGTVVYINSDTRLRYPEVFLGDERRVFLEEGEAYFDVTKDLDRPFYVMVGDVEIEVLGTEFNVNAYSESVVTTLTEGVVRISSGDKEAVLRPGQQAVATTTSLNVADVDVNDYVSWKSGLFVFRQMSLEDVIAQVYRWYGVKATFIDPKLKEETFTGIINKDKSLEHLFEVIERVVDVHFILDKKNHVIITNK